MSHDASNKCPDCCREVESLRAENERLRQSMTPRQIALSNGISPTTFRGRIRTGWAASKAATTPARPYFYEWSQK